jgi:hypothetical protein
VAVNGQQSGPFNETALKQMIQQKTFTKDSLVWKQGMAAWAKAAGVAELAALFTQAPPPVPPM